MEIEAALTSLAALSQPTRLQAFRLLVRHEPAGLAAGELARALAVPQNTLSAHLNVLAHSELVAATRKGRSVVYRANIARARTLADFLVEDCCAGAGCAAASPVLCVETAK
jgi:ArsR family transcriptional regulator